MMESHFVSDRDTAKEEKIRIRYCVMHLKNRPKIISVL